MMSQLEPSHPQHPHHLECPRCGKHTIVIQGDSRYVCLNCSWRRDITDDAGPLQVITTLVLVVLLLFIL
ncbi:MAG: hypothetical protein ACFE0J_22370 [Elainellaceae cyanobacterium]